MLNAGLSMQQGAGARAATLPRKSYVESSWSGAAEKRE